MLSFEWTSRSETVGCKLAKGEALREGLFRKELWKSVEKLKIPLSAWRERSVTTRSSNVGDVVAMRP
jgi:hypothetical protein